MTVLAPVVVYAEGLCFLSACVHNSVSSEDAERFVRMNHVAGTSNNWKLHDEPFNTGEPNPCPCDKFPDTRKHYLFAC